MRRRLAAAAVVGVCVLAALAAPGVVGHVAAAGIGGPAPARLAAARSTLAPGNGGRQRASRRAVGRTLSPAGADGSAAAVVLPALRAIGVRTPLRSLAEGGTLPVTATATGAGGAPLPGVALQAFVNGQAWGAPEVTNGQGQALLPLPLPNPGRAHVVVASPVTRSDWIWGATGVPGQIRYFARAFSLAGLAPSAIALVSAQATLQVAADASFTAYLNGHRVASGTSVRTVQTVDVAAYLRLGTNLLAIRATGGQRGQGVLARLAVTTLSGGMTLHSDAAWRVWSTAPPAWPQPADAAGSGAAARVLAPAGGGVWADMPFAGGQGLLPAVLPPGTPLPASDLRSPALTVSVVRVHLTVPAHPHHLVGMEYEPWFTPANDTWQVAEAMPLLGPYTSFDQGVLRQHALWLDRAHVNFLLIDWSNNLWGKTAWNQRGTQAQQIVDATTTLLNTYAAMRHQGLPTPQVTLLLGLDNGPSTTVGALNQEMQWIDQHYVRNPAYRGLWLYDHGKPLIVIFNGGGPAYYFPAQAAGAPLGTSGFTVRWMASQLQSNSDAQSGYWSWMDGSVQPVPTPGKGGAAQALTVTPAFFGSGGWTGPQAMGRRGGATYVREFADALTVRPHFLLINQWNEFAGQPRAASTHVDTYTAALSNDIEPTSLSGCGYASCGGWGFYYLNLTRALIHLYHQPHPQTTVLAVAAPLRGQVVCGPTLHVSWATAGAPVRRFTLLLDGHVVTSGLAASSYTLSLAGVANGAHVLTVEANGAVSALVPSYGHRAHLLAQPVPTSAQVRFTRAPACPVGEAALVTTDRGAGVYMAPAVVTRLSPAVGPWTGGTRVTIRGTGFSGATGVDFGANNPAFTFSVNAAGTAITTTSPPGFGTVYVTVTTGATVSTPVPAGRFTYQGS